MEAATLIQALLGAVLTVILAVTAWTLKTVIAVDKRQALGAQRDDQQDKELTALRIRQAELEVRIIALEKDLALLDQRQLPCQVKGAE